MVFRSSGNTVMLSILLLSVTQLPTVSHAHIRACPSGGSPLSVGLYWSTSGSRSGRQSSGIM